MVRGGAEFLCEGGRHRLFGFVEVAVVAEGGDAGAEGGC